MILSRETIEEIRVRGHSQNTPNFGDFLTLNRVKPGVGGTENPDYPEGWICRRDGRWAWFRDYSDAARYMFCDTSNSAALLTRDDALEALNAALKNMNAYSDTLKTENNPFRVLSAAMKALDSSWVALEAAWEILGSLRRYSGYRELENANRP